MSLGDISFSSVLPTKIIFGKNTANYKLLEEIEKENIRKILFVTDAFIIKIPVIKDLIVNLEESGIEVAVFSGVDPNPTTSNVSKGAECFRTRRCELIVAAGGGSVMDCAKSIAVSVTNERPVLEYRRGKEEIKGPLPSLYAIPTTAGTGSEVTSVSVISDSLSNKKYSIASELLYPKVAFIDPLMTISLPRKQVIATGLDALVHGIESYTSNNAHPISEALSIKAIEMIRESLPIAYANSNNLEAKSKLLLASTIAGMSFSMVGNGLIHAMSRPITSWFGIPHGIANAILLPYVLEYNHSSVPDKYHDIAKIFNGKYYDINKYEASRELADSVKMFTRDFDVPVHVNSSTIKINTEIVKEMAKDAFDGPTTFNNPRIPTLEEIEKIYKRIFPQLN